MYVQVSVLDDSGQHWSILGRYTRTINVLGVENVLGMEK